MKDKFEISRYRGGRYWLNTVISIMFGMVLALYANIPWNEIPVSNHWYITIPFIAGCSFCVTDCIRKYKINDKVFNTINNSLGNDKLASGKGYKKYKTLNLEDCQIENQLENLLQNIYTLRKQLEGEIIKLENKKKEIENDSKEKEHSYPYSFDRNKTKTPIISLSPQDCKSLSRHKELTKKLN